MAAVHYHPSKEPDHFHACEIEVTPFEAGGLTAILLISGERGPEFLGFGGQALIEAHRRHTHLEND